MNEVKKITIQTRAPTGCDPEAVEEGYYCVADGFVVLTDADGKPIIGAPNGQSPLTGPGAVPGGALAYTLGGRSASFCQWHCQRLTEAGHGTDVLPWPIFIAESA